MRTARVFVCVIALACACLLGSAAMAQIPTGTLSGHVSSEGAGLPGVAVTITSPALQGERQGVTTENGDYLIPLLPPGAYHVVFALTGFQDVQREVTISVGQTASLDAELSMASVSEEIVVTGNMEKISTVPQASVTYTKTFVEELAVDRNIRQATLLSPAAAETGPRSGRVPNIVISGNMSFENLFLVNGVVVNENIRGQPLDLFIEDAVEETTVSTSGISAQYGRFAGGVINTVTRAGGNEFSGSFRTNFTNQKWEGKTPLTVAQTDKVNETYEGTLGGYLWKDRVWFFLAGRDLDTTNTSFTLAPATTPYPVDRSQRRLEGKLTFAATPRHRFVATAFDLDESETGNNFNNVALDLDSLVARETPQSLKAINYTGILSNNFFVEAQYSERKFEFVGSGSLFTDLIKGTLIVGTGGERWNSPTFCGVCRIEERSNENLLGKATYFLSTDKLGSHELLAGYDTFDDIRVADNHQSGSDFRITGVTPVVIGTGTSAQVFGRFGVTATANSIQYNPIIVSSKGSHFKTNSFFVNDSWRLSDRWSFNVGLRYDQNDGEDQSGAKVIEDSKISPRLAASWDLRGDGDLLFTAAWGRYVAAIANSQADASSAAGNPANFLWFYRGPAINATGTPTVDNHAALAQIFAWFNSVGGINNRDPTIFRGASVPGLNQFLADDLASPHTDEITVGATKRLGSRGVVRVDLVHREGDDFYIDRVDLSTGIAQTPFGPLDRGIRENDSSLLKREYNGLHTQFRYRVGDTWELGGNYTLSKLEGNVDGETAGSGPVPSALLNYPEYKAFAQHNPEGDLAADQRHRARAWVVWNPFTTDHHGLSISLLETYYTGTPYGALGLVDTRASATSPPGLIVNPGYASPPTSVNYYFTDRDAFRTDTITRTDIAVNYSFKWGLFGQDLEFILQPEVLNLFNEDGVEAVNTTVQQATNTAGLQRFNPFTDTPVEGVHWRKGPTFGQPRNDLDFQLPRTFRLSAGVRF
ncbi:MAG TPA: TonB-dependent receptor [Thermoanaerobaculia bacterium]|nr:TonB-dependent receptor [Thermoanaerobaculia bacterium]